MRQISNPLTKPQKRLLPFLLIFINLIFLIACPDHTKPKESEESKTAVSSCSKTNDQWKLEWQDNFDTWTAANWEYDLGNYIIIPGGTDIKGWGNDELQSYTDAHGNTGNTGNIQIRDGKLVIRAKKETATDSKGRSFNYTSARLKSTHKQSYGCIDVRAKMPTGKGIWPAIWMLPKSDSYGSWAASGEIDIVETRGSKPTEALGTIHYGSQHPNNKYSGATYTFSDGDNISNFHSYSIIWRNDMIIWYIDGEEYSRKTSWYSNSNPFPAPFDKDFFMILNVAVGGHFDGSPDSTTPFPAEMEVDYVKFYSASNQ